LLVLSAAVLAVSGFRLLRDQAGVAASLRPWMNRDVAQLLVLGRQFLAGDRPYADWFDPNFPATHLTTFGLAVLERRTGVQSVHLFHGAVLLVALLGCASLTMGKAPGGRWSSATLLAAYLVVLYCPSIPAGPEFGQREHVFTLVLLPWLAWRAGAVGAPPRALGWLLAILLGWMGCVKPVFLVVPLFVEIARGKSLPRLPGLDAGLVAAGAVVPFGLLALLWPDSMRAFVHETVPMLMARRAFAEFIIPLRDFVNRPQMRFVAGAGLALALLILRGRSRGMLSREESRIWMVALLSAGAVALVQRKGFTYHFIPVAGVAVMGLGVVLSRIVDARMVTLVAVALVGLAYRSFAHVDRWGRIDFTPLGSLVGPGAEVMVCSTIVEYSADAYALDLRLVGPWGIHFTLAGILAEKDAAVRERELAAYRDRMVSSFTKMRPDVVLVRDIPEGRSGTLEDALTRSVHFLPLPGYRRFAPGEIARKFGGAGDWIVYRRAASATGNTRR
jgi:hypothetical protein